MDFEFAPDAARAAQIDSAVRVNLAGSLEKCVAACAGHLTWKEYALAALLATIRLYPVQPGIMALYTDLVEAIFADRMLAAQALLDELLAADFPAQRLVCTLDDAVLGPGQAARYGRLITCDNEENPAHLALRAGVLKQAQAAIDAARALLLRGAPELAAEVDLLLREIVLTQRVVAGRVEIGLTSTSSFYLWGAAFINFTAVPARVALMESLVHESAHMLLFGWSLGAPLVSNPPEARYASPLRTDLRPMDGVVHAAFVVARLNWCLAHCLEAGVLDAAERDYARHAMAENRRGFAAADAVIRGHAQFTEVGARVYEGAAAWMAQCETRLEMVATGGFEPPTKGL